MNTLRPNSYADRTFTDNILDTLNLAFLMIRAFFTRMTTHLGGKGEIRTHTGQRMKLLHNHYATLPYRNILPTSVLRLLYRVLGTFSCGLPRVWAT